MTFSEKLRREIDRRGWNPAHVGRLLGDTPRSTVMNWLSRGSLPDLPTGLKLARLLGVPLGWLLDESSDEPPAADPDRAYLEQLVAEHGIREVIRRILAADRVPTSSPVAVQGRTVPPPSQAQEKRRKQTG